MATTPAGDYQNSMYTAHNMWIPQQPIYGGPWSINPWVSLPNPWSPFPPNQDTGYTPEWIEKLQQPQPAFPTQPLQPLGPSPEQQESMIEIMKQIEKEQLKKQKAVPEKPNPFKFGPAKPKPVDVVSSVKESLYALLGKDFCNEYLQVVDSSPGKPVFGLPFLPASKTAIHDRIADLTDMALTKLGAYVIFQYDSSVVLKAFGINESLSGFIRSKQLMAALRAIPVHQSSSVLVLAQYAGAVSVDKERVKGEFRTVLEVELALKEALPRRQILRLVSPFDTPDCEVVLTITLPDGTKEQVSLTSHRRIIL